MEGQQQQKILIVDSDERVLRVMDGILANAGFDTRAASNGHAAIDLLRSREYDLVLVANHLADFSLDGFFKEFKELQRFSARPLVIVMESDPRRSWDLGPYRYLGASKAVNKWRPCDVLEAAREVLSGVRPSEH